MTTFGVCWEDDQHSPSPDQMRALGNMGMGLVRLFAFWPDINPEPDVFVWDRLDQDVSTIRDAGMKVYLDPYWCPEHAAEGKKTYLLYDSGCTTSGGIKFNTALDYCTPNPGHIDPAKTRLFAEALASRYGKTVAYFGIWNEPGELYYAPAHLGGDWGARFCAEIASPFIDGIRSVLPDAMIVGPEADDPNVLSGILRHESRYNVVSCHTYAHSYDDFAANGMPAGARNPPPLWITETGGDPSTIVDMATRARAQGVPVMLFHECDLFADKSGKPTALYEPMKAAIRS